MSAPKHLDLFAGAGGTSVGYSRAGLDVTCVDLLPHPDNPLPLVVADAMTVLAAPAIHDAFQVITASPPCPRYSSMTPSHTRDSHPDLVGPVREALTAWATRTGGVWVIEDVPGAPLHQPARLCGSSFGLRVRRHRLFESNVFLMAPPCNHAAQGTPVGVYGDHGDSRIYLRPGTGTSRAVKARDVADAQDAMGIDWMTTWDDLADSIPPAYTEFIGAQLLDHLASVAA